VATVPSGLQPGTYDIQVSAGGTAANGGPFFVVAAATISALTPVSGTVGTQVTISGSNFGASQGSSQVSIAGVPLAVTSWSDTSISATIPGNAYSGNIRVTTSIVSSNAVGFVVNSAPMLQLTVSDTPLQMNLTSPQNLDWIHWGRILGTPDRMAGVTSLISDYTALNTQPQSGSGTIAFSWTDGNHPPIVSEANEEVNTFDPNGGFQITVPADTTLKTLNLYTTVFAGQGALQATLSDGSAVAINDQSVTDTDVASKTYSIDFRAASAGQTLTVTFTAASGGVGLEAATLTPHLPAVAVTSPAAGQSFQATDTVPLSATAIQFDNAIHDVLLSTAGAPFDVTSDPFTAGFSPGASGHYTVTATATDSAGLTSNSAPVEFNVIGQGGTLSILEVAPPPTIDLNAEGTGDWILWGPQVGDLIGNNPGNILARKSGVAPLISDYNPIDNHPINTNVFAHSLCFLSDTQNDAQALNWSCTGFTMVMNSPCLRTPRHARLSFTLAWLTEMERFLHS
jgi:hypothetical protein